MENLTEKYNFALSKSDEHYDEKKKFRYSLEFNRVYSIGSLRDFIYKREIPPFYIVEDSLLYLLGKKYINTPNNTKSDIKKMTLQLMLSISVKQAQATKNLMAEIMKYTTENKEDLKLGGLNKLSKPNNLMK